MTAHTYDVAIVGVRSMLLNAAVPVILFNVAVHGLGWPEVPALGLAALVPLVDSVIELARRRRLDFIGTIVLLGIGVSLVATLLGGDPRLILIRESLLTGALGLACFASLLVLPRPLMFYAGREFMGTDVESLARYEQTWELPAGPHVHRLITTVWGAAFAGELALRVAMVLLLPTSVVLVVGPLVLGAITLACLTWTLAYGRSRQQRADALRAV
jgi:hypothetical protein